MTESGNSLSKRYGAAALVAGLLSAFGSFMIYATSVSLDPPGWVRIPTMALFPLGLLVSLGCGVVAFRGQGKSLAISGWIASGLGFALFVWAINVLA